VVSQKNQALDTWTLLQVSQVRDKLELSKVFNGSETFGTLQIAKAWAKKGVNDDSASNNNLRILQGF